MTRHLELLMIPPDLERLWFQQEAVPGAAFRLNDFVEIVSGEHVGKRGSVISLLTLEPGPTYLVEESGSGRDLEVPEAALRAA